MLNEVNAKYAEMDKYIGNPNIDITSVNDFITDVLGDKARGYDVGTSLDALNFKESLTINLDFYSYEKSISENCTGHTSIVMA